MKTKEEFLREIKEEVENNLGEGDYTITDKNGKEAEIFYNLDASAKPGGAYENYFTNFEIWKDSEEWNEYNFTEEEMISYLEKELNLFMIHDWNQYGNWVWVDVSFEEGFDEDARDYIEENCRIAYDDGELQERVDELSRTPMLKNENIYKNATVKIYNNGDVNIKKYDTVIFKDGVYTGIKDGEEETIKYDTGISITAMIE